MKLQHSSRTLLNPFAPFHHQHRKKDKVAVIMGATSFRKSRLSIYLATPFSPSSAILKSDQKEVYRDRPLFDDDDLDAREFSPLDIFSPIATTLPSPFSLPPLPPSSSAGHSWKPPPFTTTTRKNKVVVIMGATGSGNSRLSVDLATRFPFSEIINSDKMQVYRGLDITTNKIPLHQRRGVPHHLLGDVDPDAGDFSPSDFRRQAGDIISDITSRGKLPIVVGGSNSFIHALLVERFHPELNVFDAESSLPISSELRYKCCFLWVDVSFPVLSACLRKRADDMLDSGMVDELAQFFDPNATHDSANRTGLRKAIGVPEFDRYFKKFPPGSKADRMRKGAYKEAVRAIKDNTCELANRQIGKILRLKKRAGWDLRRLDATDAFRAALTSDSWPHIWERRVLEPTVKIVNRFLTEL